MLNEQPKATIHICEHEGRYGVTLVDGDWASGISGVDDIERAAGRLVQEWYLSNYGDLGDAE